MGADSKIEWTDHTFNPWWGCTKVSPGCDHCYAEAWARRYRRVEWGSGKPRLMASDAYWRQPLKWNAAANGKRARVFCASMADVFDNEVPDGWRDRLWNTIAVTPQLDWLLLTKRIGNAPKMLAAHGPRGLPPNVWLGISVVNQEEADRDIPKLLSVPARVRFLSCEPLLWAVDLTKVTYERRWGTGLLNALTGGAYDHHGASLRVERGPRLDWIIVGGESGPGARHMAPDWARQMRDQCKAHGVAFFMKQMTKKATIPDDLMIREFPA